MVYCCRRQHEQNWADPEEKVRAAVFAWLILEREYPTDGIDVEVTVPRRTPGDDADIVVYEEGACRVPYLVVENKARGINERDASQAVEQAFGNANSLRARYALYDNADESRLFEIANFPAPSAWPISWARAPRSGTVPRPLAWLPGGRGQHPGRPGGHRAGRAGAGGAAAARARRGVGAPGAARDGGAQRAPLTVWAWPPVVARCD